MDINKQSTKTAHIIGCGPTGSLWDGKGYSIGVNDCWKFGKHTNALVVVNPFSKPDQQERYKIIRDSRPQEFFSNLNRWRTHPNYVELPLRRFSNELRLDRVYNSDTSPFIAISLAAKKGYNEIVLYGVDFVDHPIIRDKWLKKEVATYLKFITFLSKFDVKVYLYQNSGAFTDLIPTYDRK